MIAILSTFILVTVVVVAVHRALGRPAADLVAVIKVIGTITVALIALSRGPETLSALLPHVTDALGSGPSG